MATLGAVIERGEHHRRVFDLLAPGFDIHSVEWPPLEVTDLYADAAPAIERVAAAGYKVAVVGNQPATTDDFFGSLDLPLHLVASSESLGAVKPDGEFFAAIAARLGEPAGSVAYVGDRLDNDVAAAERAGMRGVWLIRGPWAVIQRHQGLTAADTIHGLDELPGALRS